MVGGSQRCWQLEWVEGPMSQDVLKVETFLGVEIHAPRLYGESARDRSSAYCGSQRGVVITTKEEMQYVNCESCLTILSRFDELGDDSKITLKKIVLEGWENPSD